GGLRDRLFDVPGTFSFSQCPDCRSVWLNPRPIREDIPKCYTNYFTHEAPPPPDDQRPSRRPPSAWRDTLRRLLFEARYGWPTPGLRRNSRGGPTPRGVIRHYHHEPCIRARSGPHRTPQGVLSPPLPRRPPDLGDAKSR